jgi:hypothetical protein
MAVGLVLRAIDISDKVLERGAALLEEAAA